MYYIFAPCCVSVPKFEVLKYENYLSLCHFIVSYVSFQLSCAVICLVLEYECVYLILLNVMWVLYQYGAHVRAIVAQSV